MDTTNANAVDNHCFLQFTDGERADTFKLTLTQRRPHRWLDF